MSARLEDIRKKIDALDDKIHDLLMERADLIVDVSAEKRKNKTPIVQPAREAKMIRRLLARHRGPLPEAAIVKIWRELVGAVSLLQTGLKVSVSVDPAHAYTWDMAKEYFGSVLPMTKTSAPIVSISAVREDEATFAVVPWPQDGETAPWWQHLMNREQDMHIVCAMPYGIAKDQAAGGQNRALVISKTDFSPSGEDRSFVVLKIERDVSRAKIIDVFKEQKLQVLSITTRKNDGVSESLHLVEVDDYLTEEDDRLKKFAEKFDGMNVKTAVVGGYPVPPVYKTAEKKPDTPALEKTGTQ
jgi:chorismate mutase / prephenate dehydratase